MNKFTSILVGVAIVVASSSALAEKAPGSGPNPFSDCGIGAALFKETKWAAVTSNITWDVGTTAVTSATASPETCNGKTVEAATFIQHSYDNLVEETAQGEGEYINAMLNIFGCDAAVRSQVIAQVRNDAGQVVTDAAYATQSQQGKVVQYYQIVDNAVNASCSVS